jgi:hypothetical protein
MNFISVDINLGFKFYALSYLLTSVRTIDILPEITSWKLSSDKGGH